MFGTHDLVLFILSGLLLNLAPGPDSLLIITRSAAQGWRVGSVAALGISSGVCFHILAAALGLASLLATSSAAFAFVKYVGAAYLLVIGITMLLSQRLEPVEAAPSVVTIPLSLPLRQVFIQGFLTTVLNPKVALFFLAFVPHFIDPNAPNPPLAFLLLGSIFVFTSTLWGQFLALAAGVVSTRLRTRASLARGINRIVGGSCQDSCRIFIHAVSIWPAHFVPQRWG